MRKPKRETLYEDVDADMRDIYWADEMDAWLTDTVLPVLRQAKEDGRGWLAEDEVAPIDALIKELRNE